MTDTSSQPSIVMTIAEAAHIAKISLANAREQARQGTFPGAFQIGRLWRVHRATFEEELARMARGQRMIAGPDLILGRALNEFHARLERIPDRNSVAKS